jgi:hypothetical protein
VTLAVTGNTISGWVVRRHGMLVSLHGASTAVGRKSMGHTVAERSLKDTDFMCISYI